jgi:hypothetical protein
MLAPCVDHLLAEHMLLRDHRHWLAICFADDRDHLLFREPRFAQCAFQIGSQPLNLLMARKSVSRA